MFDDYILGVVRSALYIPCTTSVCILCVTFQLLRYLIIDRTRQIQNTTIVSSGSAIWYWVIMSLIALLPIDSTPALTHCCSNMEQAFVNPVIR
jgi:hypothetical protein